MTHPAFNAILNAASALFLLTGYYFIRRKQISAHKACMISAFAISVVFLISYLIYHYTVGHVVYTGQGWIRPVYFFILITHIILAIVIVPMILRTLWLAWKGDFTRHAKIAKITFPMWLYVSITGILVYVMLY